MKGKKYMYLKPEESLVSFLAAPELPTEVEMSSSDQRLCVGVFRFGNDSCCALIIDMSYA